MICVLSFVLAALRGFGLHARPGGSQYLVHLLDVKAWKLFRTTIPPCGGGLSSGVTQLTDPPHKPVR